jgi:RNA polymerase sigma-70 factor (ECF subfamily)
MDDSHDESAMSAAQVADFRTTHWSQVLEAGHASSPNAGAALEILCRTYWYPIYVYVRRQGHNPHDAEDLTQEFFSRLLRLNSLEAVAPHRGKFRTFLLVSLKHYLADAWDAQKALKRGGGARIFSLDDDTAEERYQLEATAEAPPDVAFERRWLLTVLEQAMTRLRQEYTASGKLRQFEAFKDLLTNPTPDGEYDRLAVELAITPGAIAVAMHRLRHRYRDLVRAEIANTVSNAEELAEELRHLMG